MDSLCNFDTATTVLRPYIGNLTTLCEPVDRLEYGEYSITMLFEKDDIVSGEHIVNLSGLGDFESFSAYISFRVTLSAGDYKQDGYCDDYCEFTIITANGDHVYNFDVDTLEDFQSAFTLAEPVDGWMVIEFIDNGGGAYFRTRFGPSESLKPNY